MSRWQVEGLKVVRPISCVVRTAQLARARLCLKGECLQIKTAFIALRPRKHNREPKVRKASLQLLPPFHLCRGILTH